MEGGGLIIGGYLVYIGDFMDGKYHGNGILYNYNRQPLYAGEFVNNCRSGIGKFYKYINNIKYLYYIIVILDYFMGWEYYIIVMEIFYIRVFEMGYLMELG